MADFNRLFKNNPNTQNQAGQNTPTTGPGAAPFQQQFKPKTTGFTNIQKILQASKGNQLGSSLQGQVTGLASQAGQNIQQAGQKFQEQVQSNRLDTAGNQSYVQNVINDPTKAVGETAEAKSIRDTFQKFREGQYLGPTQLQNADVLRQQAARVEALGRLSQSAGGRQSLLQQFIGGPQYTAGQQRLDTLLLGQQGQQLRTIKGQTTGLEQKAIGQQNLANTLAQTAAEKSRAFGQDVLGKLGTAQTAIKGTAESPADPNTIAGRLKIAQDFEKNRLSDYQQIQDYLSGKIKLGDITATKGLSESDKNLYLQDTKLGLVRALDLANRQGYLNTQDLDEISRVIAGAPADLDVNQIVRNAISNKLAQNITEAGVASRDQLARINALSSLAGQQQVYDPNAPEFQRGGIEFNKANIIGYINDELARRNIKPAAYTEPTESKGLEQWLSPEQVGKDIIADYNKINLFGSPTDTLAGAARLGTTPITAPLRVSGAVGTALIDNLKNAQNPVDYLTAAPDAAIDVAGRTAGAIGSTAGALGQSIGNQLSLSRGVNDLTSSQAAPIDRLLALSRIAASPIGASASIAGGALSETGANVLSGLGKITGGGQSIGQRIAGVGQVALAPYIAAKNAAQSAARSIGGAVRSIFCYTAGTPILMDDGSYKNIEDIKLGDKVMLGDEVTTIGTSFADGDVYKYKDTYVTGDHAVFENGKWMSVEDSALAELTDLSPKTIVYPMITKNHLVIANTHISADLMETDHPIGTPTEFRREFLNSQHERNVLLLELEKLLNDKDQKVSKEALSFFAAMV